MAKQPSGFNINDLVKPSAGKPSKKNVPKKKSKNPSGGGNDSIGQPTPPMPSGMGMGMGGY